MLPLSSQVVQVLSDNPSSETEHLHPVQRPCLQPDSGSSGGSPYTGPARPESWSAGELGAQAKREPGAAAGEDPLPHRSSPHPSSHRHSVIPSAATVPHNGWPADDQTRATCLTGSMRKQGSTGMQNVQTEDSSSESGGGQVGKADRQGSQEALIDGQQAGMLRLLYHASALQTLIAWPPKSCVWD